jgi:hypothetical protein
MGRRIAVIRPQLAQSPLEWVRVIGDHRLSQSMSLALMSRVMARVN